MKGRGMRFGRTVLMALSPSAILSAGSFAPVDFTGCPQEFLNVIHKKSLDIDFHNQ